MKSALQLSRRMILTLAIVTQLALACGDPSATATPGAKAQLIIGGSGGPVRVGERVYASLILPKGSELLTGTLSRAGCTAFEFKIEPSTGWHDPWQDWYHSGITQHADAERGPYTCGVAGGIMGAPMPPPQINFTLNDWVQFDRPGKYAISVTYRTQSRSIRDMQEDPYDDRKLTSRVTLATDEVELEVLPEARDVAERASAALAQLRSHFRDDDPPWGSADPWAVPGWMAYSPSDAVLPLLAEFYEQSMGTAKRGLIVSPHQQLVVEEMEKQLDAPRHSVSPDYLEVLAFNSARLRHPELFGDQGENWWSREGEARLRERNAAFLALLSEYTRRLLVALPHKNERPQQDSLNATLLILARWDIPGRDQLKKLATDEAAHFWRVTKETPNIWEEQWRVVASPALLPFLRKNATKGDQYQRWLYEVAPQEARHAMIAAAAREDWETAQSWYRSAPADGTPSAALDRILLKAFRHESDDEQTAWILDNILLKFGGPDLILPVRRMLASESCLGRPLLWSFLLKQEGGAGEDRLLRRYHHESISAGCDPNLSLQEVLQGNESVNALGYWSPKLEAIAVEQLDLRDQVAIGAAGLLSRFGAIKSKEKLWARLEKWHKSYSPRPADGVIRSLDHDFEEALLSAILDGYSWAPDAADIKRLRELCVYHCEDLKWARSIADVQRLSILEGLDGVRHFTIGSQTLALDRLGRWLRRFPPETRFIVTTRAFGSQSRGSGPLQEMYPELSQLFREHNLRIVDDSLFDEYGRCRQRDLNRE